jgi:hypothetical protein
MGKLEYRIPIREPLPLGRRSILSAELRQALVVLSLGFNNQNFHMQAAISVSSSVSVLMEDRPYASDSDSPWSSEQEEPIDDYSDSSNSSSETPGNELVEIYCNMRLSPSPTTLPRKIGALRQRLFELYNVLVDIYSQLESPTQALHPTSDGSWIVAVELLTSLDIPKLQDPMERANYEPPARMTLGQSIRERDKTTHKVAERPFIC